MSQPSSIPTRVLQRYQSQITRDLLPTLEPIRSLDDQHERQRRQRTHSGVGHQTLGLRTLLHFLFDRLTQFSDRRVQSIQQLQQIVPSPARPQGYRLQLVHDPGACLHHAVPVPQPLPQITILPTRYPDPWKVILQQQAQNVLCILAIRLLLAFALPTDLSGVPDPQLKVQFRQQSLEPARMPTGFHPHAHLLSLGRELTVELLPCLRMLQSALLQFPGFGIHKRNLLKGRVVICSYNDHCSAPFSRAFWLVATTKVYSGLGSRHCHGINYTHNPVGSCPGKALRGRPIPLLRGAARCRNPFFSSSNIVDPIYAARLRRKEQHSDDDVYRRLEEIRQRCLAPYYEQLKNDKETNA